MAGLVVFGGCGRDDIQVYRVEKEGGSRALAVPAPKGWEAAPPGEMRVASFHIKGPGGKMADVSVIPLPGQAGTDLSNVNRWRGQLGLTAISEDELTKLVQSVDVAGSSGQLYELSGENSGSGDKTRMLAAVLRKDGNAWFFKMTGDDALVAEQKPAFLGYLKTFQFPGTGSETASAQPQLPPDHPPIGGSAGSEASAPAPSSSSEPRPNWTVPSGWQETAAGQFLVAKFLIPAPDKSSAAVNISMSAGDGGGLVINVNRWRKQLGLSDLDDPGVNQLVTKLDAGGMQAMLVDMSGTDPRSGEKARIVAAIVSQSKQTWFYKLMGPVALVEREKDSFLKFVQTTQYPQ